MSLAFIYKNRNLILDVEKHFIFFVNLMETGQLAQVAIDILEWSWDIVDVIWNPLTSNEWFLNTILHNSVRFRFAIMIFLLRIIALIRTIKDSNARSYSIWFQFLSALIVIILGPIFWILLYIAIRPQWWKRDKTPRRDASFINVQVCDSCGYFNCIENTYCVNCWEYLQSGCRECQSIYPKSYSYCPDCWAPNLPE